MSSTPFSSDWGQEAAPEEGKPSTVTGSTKESKVQKAMNDYVFSSAPVRADFFLQKSDSMI